MKKTLKIFFAILLIILVKLLLSFTINEIIIVNYKNNVYNTNLIKTLYLFNFNQSYIAYYNDGNILYKNNNFEKAIDKYEKAIDRKPPQKKVCDIRINLSLAMIKTIDTTNSNDAFDKLEEAKNNLYNNNCANPTDDSGSSKEAEEFEEEIKKLEEQLENGTDDNSSSNDNQEDDSNDEKDEYSDIEQEIKENEKKANSSRQSDITNYENLDDYEYYSGKRW